MVFRQFLFTMSSRVGCVFATLTKMRPEFILNSRNLLIYSELRINSVHIFVSVTCSLLFG